MSVAQSRWRMLFLLQIFLEKKEARLEILQIFEQFKAAILQIAFVYG